MDAHSLELPSPALKAVHMQPLSTDAHDVLAPSPKQFHSQDHSSWVALGTEPEELTLDHCLPTGQSFRWYHEGSAQYIGVIGQRLVRVCQTESDCYYQVVARAAGADAAQDDIVIRDYFNLPNAMGARQPGSGDGKATSSTGVQLAQLSATWVKACTRYAAIQPHIQGARMLRQDPLECLMQFICSSNNHISRIHGMVERLCASYGTPLLDRASLPPAPPAPPSANQQQPPAAPTPTRTLAVAIQGEGDSTSQQFSDVVAAVDHGTDGVADAEAVQQAKKRKVGKRVEVSSGSPATAVVRDGATGDGVSSSSDAEGSPAGGAARGKARRKKARSGGGGGDGGDGGGANSPVRAKPLPATFFAFPTLEQLSRATEEELRAAGFGYRAKFIVGSVAYLMQQPGGGQTWLAGLRTISYKEAAESLSELPGVGPKVAACVCLFSLDKHEAIPVDTHVWQIATKYYMPSLKGKTLTKKMHDDVQQAFVDRFGPYAGWAHNAMFISELASHKHLVP